MKKMNVIIDTDPGADDAIAIAALLKNTFFNVIGITSIGGNVDPAKTKRNAIGIADLMDRSDVPVLAGAKKPLFRAFEDASYVHGETGVDGLTMDLARIKELETRQPEQHAVDFIIEQSKKYDDLQLIIIGPMTNIAMAYQKDPSLKDRIAGLSIMGGAFGNPTGNSGEARQAEFNILCDPHAAEIVLQNFRNIRLLPLDVTHAYLQDRSLRDWMAGLSERGANFANMLQAYADAYANFSDFRDECPLHDSHAVMALTSPETWSWERGFVDVILDGATSEGQTILRPNTQGNIEVAKTLDVPAFDQLLRQQLQRAFV
jgi:purine nucleosidase